MRSLSTIFSIFAVVSAAIAIPIPNFETGCVGFCVRETEPEPIVKFESVVRRDANPEPGCGKFCDRSAVPSLFPNPSS
ncbi:hypothetical protein DFH11DRAFT_1726232 [Phellopilus nigrolimitatus]|nr:hypothetical protein DFH11DRAFT_1726232 [Phellopilus nigrolimitatus]